MIGLARAAGGWRVEALGGSLVTPVVVLATNAYTTSRVWPGLYETLIPMRAYQMVSAPLGEHVRDRVLPGGQPLTDTRRLFSGVRRHADGRIHVSADGPVFDMNGEPNVGKVNRRLATLFPWLGPLHWEHRWAGWVGMTYDLNPHLHELAPGLWAALGYSGRGIAMATMMGRDLAARIAGASDAALAFPLSPLRSSRIRADRQAPRRLPAQLLSRARRARRHAARHRMSSLTALRCAECSALALPPKELCPSCQRRRWESIEGGAINARAKISIAPAKRIENFVPAVGRTIHPPDH